MCECSRLCKEADGYTTRHDGAGDRSGVFHLNFILELVSEQLRNALLRQGGREYRREYRTEDRREYGGVK
jgi:hypothetical protein